MALGLPVGSLQLQALAPPWLQAMPEFQWEVRKQLCQCTKVVPNLPCGCLYIPGVGFLSAVADSVGLS